MFGRKPRSINLGEPAIQQLIARALSGEYGAVREIYALCSPEIASSNAWDWWLDRVEAQLSGDVRVSALAFMLDAGNIPPWGDVTPGQYERRRRLLEHHP